MKAGDDPYWENAQHDNDGGSGGETATTEVEGTTAAWEGRRLHGPGSEGLLGSLSSTIDNNLRLFR